jgi:hypothetical protein
MINKKLFLVNIVISLRSGPSFDYDGNCHGDEQPEKAPES